MSLNNEYHKLVSLSDCNASGENLSHVTAIASNVLFLLQKNSNVTKRVYLAKYESAQQLKGPATKTVAATLAQAIGQRYQSHKEASSGEASTSFEAKKEAPFEGDIPLILPILSRLMIKWPGQESLREIVGRIVLLHFFDPILFTLLCNEFKHRNLKVEPPFTTPDFYQEPDWWKNISKSFSTKEIQVKSPLEYSLCSKRQALHQLSALFDATVNTLNAAIPIHSERNSAVSLSLSSILELLLDDSHVKDLVLMIICHQKDLIIRINSLSILVTEIIKKQASTIMELLASRQTAVTVYGVLHSFSGAQFLLSLYTQKERSAYEFVTKSPLVYALDFLDHANSSSEQAYPIHATYIGIASQKIATLCGEKESLVLLYEDFNRAAKVQSLLAVLSSFVIETVKFKFQLRRDNQALELLQFILEEYGTPIPPLAKPNYFFVDRKPLKMMRDVSTFELSYDLTDLNVSVRLIFYAIKKIVKVEIDEVLAVTIEEGLIQKLGSRILRLMFCCFFAILLAHSGSNENGANKIACVDEIAKISKVVAGCFRGHGSLFYLTLFNFANDICHANTIAVPLIFELVKIVIETNDPSDQADFVKSAVETLQFTFGCSLNEDVNSDIHEVRVTRAEYSALYGKNKLGNSAYSA